MTFSADLAYLDTYLPTTVSQYFDRRTRLWVVIDISLYPNVAMNMVEVLIVVVEDEREH